MEEEEEEERRPPRRQQPPRRYVIIGGGIAGVTAAEELLDLADQHVEVTLLTATRTVKQVGRVVKWTRKLEEVDVVERDADDLARGRCNLRVLQTRVTGVDAEAHVVHCQGDLLEREWVDFLLESAPGEASYRCENADSIRWRFDGGTDGSRVPFDRCLVATGAAPKLVSAHPNVLGIRDTESVEELGRRLASARRVMVVGNGGIALEVVHEVLGCELVWAVKDGYVGNTFFDSTASGFVLPQLEQRRPVRIVGGREAGAVTSSGALPQQAPKRPRSVQRSTTWKGAFVMTILTNITCDDCHCCSHCAGQLPLNRGP